MKGRKWGDGEINIKEEEKNRRIMQKKTIWKENRQKTSWWKNKYTWRTKESEDYVTKKKDDMKGREPENEVMER